VGLTVLDAGLVIAVLDAGDAHHASAVRALAEARERRDELILPVSAYAECLVAPSRSGPAAVAVVDRCLDALPVRVEPANRHIGAAAASLRAAHGPSLRLPDALVVASAVVLGADRVITTDARWPELPVRVEVLEATARSDQNA
jgi:predicted nucleic acid-binding protein